MYEYICQFIICISCNRGAVCKNEIFLINLNYVINRKDRKHIETSYVFAQNGISFGKCSGLYLKLLRESRLRAKCHPKATFMRGNALRG